MGAARAPPRARPAAGCRGPSGARATASAPPRAAKVMSSSKLYVNVSRAWFLTYLRGRGGGGGGGGAGGGRDATLKAALPPGTVSSCARQKRGDTQRATQSLHTEHAYAYTCQDAGMYAGSGSDPASRPTTLNTQDACMTEIDRRFRCAPSRAADSARTRGSGGGAVGVAAGQSP